MEVIGLGGVGKLYAEPPPWLSTTWEHNKEETRERGSPHLDPAGTLISDIWSPELGEIICVVHTPPLACGIR